MSDLVKRLRDEHLPLSRGEVADEVEKLEAKLAEARCEIDFCNAQLEAWQTMASPATKGLVRKRLEELKKGT